MSKDINQLCVRYIAWSLCLVIVLSALACFVARVFEINEMTGPIIVSILFSVVVECSDVLIWRKVAKTSPNSLTTFYSAVSGFRMLLALATMMVCYFVVGRGAVMPYVITLLVYYSVLLAHHAIFFSRLANSGNKLN